jgi:hypothetical protein
VDKNDIGDENVRESKLNLSNSASLLEYPVRLTLSCSSIESQVKLVAWLANHAANGPSECEEETISNIDSTAGYRKS